MNSLQNSENVCLPSPLSSAKRSLVEENETEKEAEGDDRELTSPPIESLLERIEPSTVAFNPYRFNGQPVKRLKMENEGSDFGISEVEDDCVTFGRYVTATLRQMPKVQKLLAERIIADVCYKGQTHSLHGNTVVGTPVNSVQQPYPVYVPRSNHFNRGTDYSLIHQQPVPLRPHTPLPVQVNAHLQQYQNFVNIQQQSEPCTSQIHNIGSTENVQ